MRKWLIVPMLALVVGLLCLTVIPAHAAAHAAGSARQAGCSSHAQNTHHPLVRCAATGMLTGNVLAGPTCPVERADHPCPPAPVRGARVRIERPNGGLVTTAMTDARGHFSANLPPGDYVVRVSSASGYLGRRSGAAPVHITSGHIAHVRIMLDTGMR